jgi:hypothetical protein
MAKGRAPTLNLYDWVRLRDHEIVALGLLPRDRLCFTGHERALGEVWLQSVGLWGDIEPAEVIDNVAPWNAVLPASGAAFRQFKARHRLQSRRQFQRRHGPGAWRRAEVSYAAHGQAQAALGERNGFYVSVGVACDYATGRMLRSKPARSLGMLNVEVVAWAQVLANLLEHHAINYGEWLGFDDGAKLFLWGLSCEEGLCDVMHVLHRPAVRHLQGFGVYPEGASSSACA